MMVCVPQTMVTKNPVPITQDGIFIYAYTNETYEVLYLLPLHIQPPWSVAHRPPTASSIYLYLIFAFSYKKEKFFLNSICL